MLAKGRRADFQGPGGIHSPITRQVSLVVSSEYCRSLEGVKGSPASAPRPQPHPGCLTVFSETEQEVGLHNVRIQEAIGLLKATSRELVTHIHLSPAIRPFGALPLSTGAARAWGPPPEALGHRIHYCANWQHHTGWEGKWWVRKGTPALHCRPTHNGAGGWGPFLCVGA